jgi:hypothetical protein
MEYFYLKCAFLLQEKLNLYDNLLEILTQRYMELKNDLPAGKAGVHREFIDIIIFLNVILF